MTKRDERNWFNILYFTLIGIGVAGLVCYRIPDVLASLSRIRWDRLGPVLFIVGGFTLSCLFAYFSKKHLELADITPPRKEKLRFLMRSPAIPRWVKNLHIAGTIFVMLGVGGVLLAVFGIPILPGVRRIWNRGMLPWILLFSGLAALSILLYIPKKYRQTVHVHTGMTETHQWVVAWALASAAAIGTGLWMIGSALFGA
jgi:formate-dependent nitrite reductase membrane component NrfD